MTDESESPRVFHLASVGNSVASALLLAAGIVCVAGQFSSMFGWLHMGDGELSAEIGAEGWLLQWNFSGTAASLRPAVIGITPQWRRTTDAATWNKALADSDLQNPLPGVLVAHGPDFAIIAFRHWLIVLSTFATKLGLHLLIQRCYSNEASARETH